MMRLAETPITEKQMRVLVLIVEQFGGEIEASIANYRRLSDMIGWRHYSSAVDVLFKFRAKGALSSIGTSMTRPEKWKVV